MANCIPVWPSSMPARTRMTEGIRGLANAARELAQADTSAVVEGFGKLGTRRFTLAA